MGKVLKVREIGDPILKKECDEVDIKNTNKDIILRECNYVDYDYESKNQEEMKKMKQVLFATTNPAKIKRYAEQLEKRGIKVITIKDLRINLHVEENGKNAIENAYIKAKTYYEATGFTTIGIDDNLFIEELPEDKQPGTHVRRIKGKELTDDEMIEYYSKLVEEYGGKLTARWVYGMVIYNGQDAKEYSWSKNHFYLVNKPCEKKNPGYPLNSISIMPECNKYFAELTQEDKNKQNYNENDVIDFISENI